VPVDQKRGSAKTGAAESVRPENGRRVAAPAANPDKTKWPRRFFAFIRGFFTLLPRFFSLFLQETSCGLQRQKLCEPWKTRRPDNPQWMSR
jgi:hypothetical protein